MIKETEFGRIEITNVPLPKGWSEVNGTYTVSGRVLAVNYEENDLFHVITLNDDGTEPCEVYHGEIPQRRTANGIRWMCFSDNCRVLLGDYILEASPNLDHARSAKLLPVRYPEELTGFPGLFRHWSEIIVSPDGEHIVWTMLTFTGADNFLGRLIRRENDYVIEDVCCISTRESMKPDAEREGYMIPQVLRGGEVKQFIHGGNAISLVGNSDSLSDSVIEELDTGITRQFSRTSGYEETAVFSPDEILAVCMSPRFSPATDCSILGLVPLPHSTYVRSGIINPAYNYAIGSQRAFRMGNIGPALVDVKRTFTEGRAYQGVDLSDPENQFVYVSPMSWAPCSTKAMWNEHTRLSDPKKKSRLRIVKLLDRAPGKPVLEVKTPDAAQIPYAIRLEEFLRPLTRVEVPYKIMGKHSGEILYRLNEETGYREQIYENFSDDGKTFYQGSIASKCPPSMFDAVDNIFCGDLSVSGEHCGALRARIVFTQKSPRDPVMLSFDKWEDGNPASFGTATYDGKTISVNSMMK